MIATCDLEDIKSKGDRFSWVGELHTHTIKSCLDRAFINSEGAASFPFADLEFLDFTGLDHRPLLLTLEKSEIQKKIPFRFDKRLLHVPHFKAHVVNGWNIKNTHQRIHIIDKLRTYRQSMASLKHKSNMNSRDKINQLQAALNRSMASLIRSERQLIPQIQRELTKAHHHEEKYW